MKKLGCGVLGFLLVVFGMALPAFADENDVSELKEQIGKLTKRVAELESQAERPANIVPSGAAPAGNVIEGALSGVKLTGFVDTGYHWNFHQPPRSATPSGTAVTRNQSIGVFDTNANSFTLHAVEVDLEKTAPEDGGVGFRTDFLYGMDAKVINSTGAEIDEFDIEQAYVDGRIPIHALDGNEVLGDNLYVRVGKYVTLAGAEVIEAKDNWNVTRSILFGYAIPFTHTGVRGAYGMWSDKVTLTAGLNNGWDVLEDNNTGKTFEGQIAFKPTDDFLLTGTLYAGPENLNQGSHRRQLWDFVALWRATDKLSLMANIDVGREARVVSGSDVDDAQWWGWALYARYQATEKLAFAGRTEWFLDDDRFRVGTGSLQNALDARERDYWEWTYTTEYKIYDNLISRLEYRYDWADTKIFDGESYQSTISAQLIYNFA